MRARPYALTTTGRLRARGFAPFPQIGALVRAGVSIIYKPSGPEAHIHILHHLRTLCDHAIAASDSKVLQGLLEDVPADGDR